MKKQEGLAFKVFASKEELMAWANSKDGTEYIINIHMENEGWIIWYIIE